MAECSEHSLLHRLDEWRESHMRVHDLERRGVADARETMERRLDGMNEFRAALQDTQAKCVSRELFDSTVAAMGQALVTVERSMGDRVSSLERLLPIVALLSAASGAGIAGIVVRVMEG